jgi:hypothetical protein
LLVVAIARYDSSSRLAPHPATAAKLPNLSLRGALVLLSLIGIGGYNAIHWSSMTASDWGTWVGALGTVLAFVGTIWLATSQDRQRRRAAQDVAHLVAARIAGELESAINQSENLQAALEFSDESKTNIWKHFPVRSFPEHDSALCDVQSLALLTPLPERAAHRIARAVGLLQNVTTDISQYSDGTRWGNVTPGGRAYYAKRWSAIISQALELLSVAKGQCVKAADTGAPHPTPEEVYGPWIDQDDLA